MLLREIEKERFSINFLLLQNCAKYCLACGTGTEAGDRTGTKTFPKLEPNPQQIIMVTQH